MTVPNAHVILYAATTSDYQMALGAAGVSGIPAANVTGDFSAAWTHVQSGSKLVLAVGGAALNALYYNPCNWPNPSRQPGGHTPFAYAPVPAATLPGPNYFVNSAGSTAQDTYKLAAMLAYYAVHGQYPNGYGALPHTLAAKEVCAPHSAADVRCPC